MQEMLFHNFDIMIIVVHIIYEPLHDKTNKMICAPSEDSNQPGHQLSLIRVFACAQRVVEDPMFFHADSGDFDQTGLI